MFCTSTSSSNAHPLHLSVGAPYLNGPAVHEMEELLEGVDGLGMDLWGKAGKAKNPTTGHFDSRIFAW